MATDVTMKFHSEYDGEGTIHIEESSHGCYLYVNETSEEHPLALLDLFYMNEKTCGSCAWHEDAPFPQLVIFDPVGGSDDPVAIVQFTQHGVKIQVDDNVEVIRHRNL